MQQSIYTLDPIQSARYSVPVITLNDEGSDKVLLKQLIDNELDFRRRDAKGLRPDTHSPFTFFRLRPSQSHELLQKLACTQRLFFRGKPLICDFFSRLSLEYLVEQKESSFHITPLLNVAKRSLKPSECDLLLQGKPHIVLLDGFLRFVDDNVSWEELHELTLSKSEYTRWRKEAAFPTHELAAEKPRETTPVLKLTDQSLAFANLEAEAAFEKDLIEAGFIKKPTGSSTYYCPTDQAPQVIQFLLELGWKVIDCKNNELLPLTKIDVHVEQSILQGKATFATQEVNITEVAKALQKNERQIALGAGKSGLLSFDTQKGMALLLKETEIVAGMAKLPKRSLSLAAEVLKTDALQSLIKPELLAEAIVTAAFSGSLRPYQQIGVNWMKNLYDSGSSGLLADEMGLGKTVQVLAFLATKSPLPRTLIVAPTSLLHNWKQEIEKFLPGTTPALYHGPDRQEHLHKPLLITSYGTLRTDSFLQTVSFDCLILDEAQAIKNRDTKNAESCMRLKARFRLSLTGTPVENSLAELHTHYHFLEPGLLGSNDSLSQIRRQIAPFFLRRKKVDVAKDLPEKVEQTVVVPMTDRQKQHYTSFVESLKLGLLKKVSLDGASKHRMEILEAILRLRQIACHPALLSQMFNDTEELSSGKFTLVLEDIQTLVEEGKKVLLFSQFSSMLQLFTKELRARNIPFLLLDGKTENRQELVDRFQNDPTVPLFLMSLKAGGVGLNLTRADYVLIYDPWWNRAQELQAIDRAHRIGRTGTVFCKRYVSEESLEEKILLLQEKKAALAQALFEEEEEKSASWELFGELLE